MVSLPLSLTPSSSIVSSRPVTGKNKQTKKSLKLKIIKKCCSYNAEQDRARDTKKNKQTGHLKSNKREKKRIKDRKFPREAVSV